MKLNYKEQTEFRSGVGMLLYLLKFSRPDLSNPIREVAKVMDGATQGHLKTLYRLIKFTLETRNKALKMEPCDWEFTDGEIIWMLQAYSDSDWAKDTETRRSVTGYIVYLNGCAVLWKSKLQRNVTLSSSESEYCAGSETVQGILYVKMILEFLGIKVKLPIIVHIDNIGAIYMSNNEMSGTRTRHIDCRYHFVKEYIEDGVIKIIFVRSEKNDADIFTKNLNAELYERHVAKYIEVIGEVEDAD